jgi:tetratricopeptide (TPR) repeat protein
MVAVMADDLPGVEAAIPGPVKNLAKPAMTEFPGGIRLAVSTTSEAAQDHVNQGLNHLNAGWDFEASRHFAAALQEDPDCLLAHWGMVLSLIDPTPEAIGARDAAMERLLDLIEKGAGTELERGYAYGLIKYIHEGPAAAANAFHKVSARFPNEIQAAVLAALFDRGGYDANGDPTPSQENAEKQLRALISRHVQSPLPVHALLFIRAEGPASAEMVEFARSLARQAPEYPPYQHLLGHYEWRAGNHIAAAAAFSHASELYQKWMNEQRVTLADCPEWLRSECYRAVAMLAMGQTENALAAAGKLAALPLIPERPASAGNRFLMWEVKTLPARMLIRQNAPGSARKAAASLPKPDQLAAFRDHSLAYWWIDGLRLVFEGRGLINEKKTDSTREVLAALTQHAEAMTRFRNAAQAGGEISAWSRNLRALEILTSELRADLTMQGSAELRPTAFNWFSAAADRQSPASMLLPPAVLSPMAARLGDFLLADGKSTEAIEAYQQALAIFPNHLSTLAALRKACEAAGDSNRAAEISRLIESLQKP